MPFEIPSREPCPFCENVQLGVSSGGVECVKLLEDEFALAFVAPRPIQAGHVLVISKRHASTMLDVSEGELGAIMQLVRRLSIALVATLDPAGLNVFQNNGVLADQAVPHFHVHVVPRYPDDGGTFRPPQELTPLKERVSFAQQLLAYLDQ
jgi:histidine triad (HIT) family protein